MSNFWHCAWVHPVQAGGWQDAETESVMITVRELMTPVGTQVCPDQRLTEVLALMKRNRHSCAVVRTPAAQQDESDQPHQEVLGLIREQDLLGVLHQVLTSGDLSVGRARDVMMVNPVCVPASASLLDALKLAQESRQRQMPVVDEQHQLVGMITQTDIAHAYIRILECQSELVDVNRALRVESLQDALLAIGNRRAMERALKRLFSQPDRSFALALLDLDWFKKYNDLYGHQAGDRALQRVSDAIKAHMRQDDSLYRYGGEELLLLMRDTDLEGAWQGANRVREAVQQLGIEHSDSPFGVLTLSAGVASKPQPDVQTLIAKADAALYYAKTHGHNRVIRSDDQGVADTLEYARR